MYLLKYSRVEYSKVYYSKASEYNVLYIPIKGVQCPPMFEMSVSGEYAYNMYVKKKPSEEMANSPLPCAPTHPHDQTQHGPW